VEKSSAGTISTRLVLYDVGLEHVSKLVPLVPIENSVLLEALGSSIRHVKSVVGIVVDK
jgi:hypothetical protein